jgi:hypothetical protein
MGEVLTYPHCKTVTSYETFHNSSELTDPVELRVTADMKFGTWNVKKLYSPGTLKTVARGLAKYRLDLLGVQGFRWDKGGNGGQRTILFSKEKEIISTN